MFFHSFYFSTMNLSLFFSLNKRNAEFKKRLSSDANKAIYASNTESSSPNRKASKIHEEAMPLNTIDSDNEDAIPAFPKAAEDPLLATSESYNGGLKVRLTQV